MATIALTEFYSNLDDWPGRLFEAKSDTTVLTKTDTKFIFRHGASSGDFANFRIEVSGSPTGTGFDYDAGEPISGRMTRIRILDGAGNVVLTISDLGNNPLTTDLSQFYASVFGTEGPDGNGIEPNLHSAWSHLMLGRDTITGTDGDDDRAMPSFDLGDDVYNLLGGDDFASGSLGNDTINGGDGRDHLSYEETNWTLGGPAIRGATINVETGVVLDPWGGRDKISGFEEFQGSRFNDTFIGSNTLQDRFSGGRGRDTIDGGNNSLTPTGDRDEDRRDEVRYDRDARDGGRRGIVVDLETSFSNGSITGRIRDGFGNLDTVIDIERVVGTRYNDTFVGSRMGNNFAGGAGVDSYDGQDGWDTVSFGRWTGNTGPTSGIVLDLTRATGQVRNDGYGNVETMLNVESVYGTELGDSVMGGSGEDEMGLGFGRDTMTGGGDTDWFYWDNLGQFGEGDRVTDFTATGPDADKVAFWTPGIDGMGTTLTLVNGTAATQAGVETFIFNANIDTLFWDADGLGGAAAVAVVVLTGVNALTAANFDLWT